MLRYFTQTNSELQDVTVPLHENSISTSTLQVLLPGEKDHEPDPDTGVRGTL